MTFSRHLEWLNKTQEIALEPALEICDAHHHLWDYPGSRYLVDEYLQDTGGGHNITKSVFVECHTSYRTSGPVEMRPVGETEFIASVTGKANLSGNRTKVAAGIVGFADLKLGDEVAPVLEALIDAGKGRFRGIRNITCWDRNPKIKRWTDIPDLLMQPVFRLGYSHLRKYNLTYDTWLYHTQLPQLTDLAQSFPETTIILNHLGGPLGIESYATQKDDVYRQWQKSIKDLAQCPNVVVKIGGLAIEMLGHDWTVNPVPPASHQLAQDFAPWYLYCIEAFGPQRCMLESNYPVDKLGYSYTVMWNAMKIMTKSFSQSERADLFYNTAIKTYRI